MTRLVSLFEIMKVIETEYKGIRFRSRTEARWAVFMSESGVQYEYEPEGFDLGKSGWYIPDFWLPEIGKFVEIKPSIPVPGRESPTEALCLSTKKDVITFCGSPTPPDFRDNYREDGYLVSCKWSGAEYAGTDKCGEDTSYWFCCCHHCKTVGIEFNGRADRIGRCKCPKSGLGNGDKGYNHDDPVLLRAYYAAANAFRF